MRDAREYDLHDQRSGLWADVAVRGGDIVFEPRPTHQRGRYLGLAAAAFALVFIAAPILRRGATLLELAIGAALAMVLGNLAFSAWRRSPKPIHVSWDEASEDSNEVHVDADQVRAVIARENEGRYSDDTPLAQIYLEIEANDRPLLVYQQRLSQAAKVKEVAQQIASRMNAEIVDLL